MKSILFEMKLFKKFSCSFLLLLGFLSSCNKPVYKYNSDFEGNWRTAVIYDTILNKNVMSEIVIDGPDGTYSNTCDPCGVDLCNCISSQVGKAVMNTSRTQMKIGSNSYALTIQQEPTVNALGQTTIIIRNQTYYKQ
jgi:hypothetical protein